MTIYGCKHPQPPGILIMSGEVVDIPETYIFRKEENGELTLLIPYAINFCPFCGEPI